MLDPVEAEPIRCRTDSMAFQGAGGMPLRGGRAMVWAVGGIAVPTVIVAVLYLSVYGLDRADKFGSVIGAEVSVLSLLISLTQLFTEPPYPAPLPLPPGPAR